VPGLQELARWRVTVPVEVCKPPTTLAGFSDSEESVGEGTGTGVTVSAAVRLASPEAAEIVTAVDTFTALVLTTSSRLVAAPYKL
jgi:hypothetical protein